MSFFHFVKKISKVNKASRNGTKNQFNGLNYVQKPIVIVIWPPGVKIQARTKSLQIWQLTSFFRIVHNIRVVVQVASSTPAAPYICEKHYRSIIKPAWNMSRAILPRYWGKHRLKLASQWVLVYRTTFGKVKSIKFIRVIVFIPLSSNTHIGFKGYILGCIL